MDLARDGSLDVVHFVDPAPGFFERTDDSWAPHRPSVSMLQIDWNDPNLSLVDPAGDGRVGVMIMEGGNSYQNPIPPNPTENDLMNYARDWR